MTNLKTREITAATMAILLFIVFSWLVQTHLDTVTHLIGDTARGMAIYVLVSIITIILAPVATLPLIPVGAGLWGTFLTGLLNIFAWTIGAMIAFALARVAGIRFVRKVVSLEKLEQIEKRIPEKNVFWTIVFLRMVMPVDILSYALGLFSRVRADLYFWATLVGITPFAFILAYVGTVPFSYQLLGLILVAFILVLALRLKVKRDS